MPVIDRQLTYRVTIAGDVYRIAPDLQINESMDSLCTVAEFSIASRPSDLPEDGDTVLIELLDIGAGRAYPIFGGTVNVRTVQAQPWNYRITAVDQLEKLRRMRTSGDLNLTGMTDREAWMEIADACDLDYDPDDIKGTSYELGEHVPIKWHKDNQTSGGQFISEMDELFGFKTLTIGDNRIIRIHLDQTPAVGTGLYRSYTKGVNLDFLSDTRVIGDRDQLQNAWRVTGVLQEINDSCTAQVWAAAEAGSGYLASKRVRVGVQDYGSDMIQDESLAEAVVRRLMRLTNRLPDRFTVQAINDHNVHVGSKLRIVDTTKGIGASAGKFCMVRSIVRNGFTMALELMPGPGGNEGTVTHGTQKICNKTGTDVDTPGDFSPPGFDYPPLTDGSDDGFEWPGGADDTEGEDPAPQPLEGCTTSASFTDCAESDADTCEDGSTSTTDLSGTSPPDFCATYLGPERLQTNSFTAGGIGFSTECQVLVPWRVGSGSATAFFHVTEDGAVDYVQTALGDSTLTLYANTELDPNDQSAATDIEFDVPVGMTVSGIVQFFVPGSVLTVNMPPVVGGVESGSPGPSIQIYADPGFTITPSGGELQTFGVALSTDFQGPLIAGDADPNVSLGSGNYNNGGYVISSPAALGVPVAFSVVFDETHKNGWGWTLATTDLGSGYLESLDFINPASPLPGEPALPTNTCGDDHDAHKLRVVLNPGGVGTKAEPGVRLYGLVAGHSTCEVNTEFLP